ncbi:MAG TPA: 3'-5' exonuclease [Solirubrobacteraceae bacterium]|jgi:DNA polymerase-3 subunit epsilon
MPSRRTPWREARFCVVDLELSDLDRRRGEIVSFAALAIDEGRVVLRSAVSGLVRPTRALAEQSIRVHGIRASDLAQAPALAEAIEPLLEAMTARVLIAHHAPVERAFLGPALRQAGVRLRGPLLDTAVLARLWLTERDEALPPPMGLGELAGALGLPVHSPHTAAGDALTTAQLFLAAVSALDARRPETVRRLARAPSRLADLGTYWR